MAEARPPASRRMNRNTLWLIGVAVAAVIVAALMLNSRATIQTGAQVYRSETTNTPTGMASAEAGGASGGARQGETVVGPRPSGG